MTKAAPLVVVDTSVIVDYLTGVDSGLQDAARWALEEHNESHRVLLPAIVIAEIAGCGAVSGDHGGKAARGERVGMALTWISQSHFLVAELTERLAKKAALLAAEHKLKGPDAAVVATALQWDARVIYTRDSDQLKLDGVFPSLAIEPPVRPLVIKNQQEALALMLGEHPAQRRP